MYLRGPGSKQENTSFLFGIPSGTDGVRATLGVMRALVRQFRTNEEIHALARRLTMKLPQKDWSGEVRALHAYVRDGIRYLKDTNEVERVQTPLVTVDIGTGDCDDKSVLLATLLEAIGHPARFVAVGFEPGHFSHVYVETKIGPKWIPLETTAYMQPGQAPLRAVSRLIVKV